ncbi:MAG: alanyl-tRNA editing protein [Chloroflexota bacterium]
MAELLYQTDSYIRHFPATVLAVDGQAVELDRTAFYPGGGGQAHDLGTLDGIPVVEVKKEADSVRHILSGPLPAVGATVAGELDWERRYALMRTHTALHILCGVIFRDYGAVVTGSNMKPLEGRMDFELEATGAEFWEQVEARANQEIAAARSISVRILPRDEAFKIPDLIRTKVSLLPPGISHIRVVDIQGLDLQADGGTHVANTREVGHIRVTGHESKGRINKRLRIAVE